MQAAAQLAMPELLEERVRMFERLRQRGESRPTPIWYLGAWLQGVVTGAAIAYFGDPARGKLRRTLARDMFASRARRLLGATAQACRLGALAVYGTWQKAVHAQPEHWSVPDDATLAQRVETELFRDPTIPKGRININVEAGIVVLRRELDRPEQIRAVEEAVSRMAGVRGVHNLLHLRGTTVPDRGSVLPAP